MKNYLRVSLAFLVSLLVLTSPLALAAAKQKAAPALLSYQSLMRLSPAKRAAYLKDIAEMLVKLEAIQESGDENKYADFKEQILNMLQMFPQAEAQPNDGVQKPTEREYVSPLGKKEITDRLPKEEDAPAVKNPGKKFPKKDVAPAQKPKVNPEEQAVAPTKPSGETAPAPQAASKCEVEAPVSCKEYSAEEKKAARKEINDPSKFKKEERLCIIGGTFSTYRNGKAAPGQCKKAKVDKCKPSEGLCNPYLFCTQYADAAKSSKLPTVCLPLKVGNKVDLTARCDALFNGDLAKLKLKKCEEGQLPPGFQEKWNEMRAALTSNYKNFCAREAFKILNCNECGVMAKYLGEAAAKATGSACVEEPVAAAKAEGVISYPYDVPPENEGSKKGAR